MPTQLTGIGDSYLEPGTFIEIKFGVGPGGGFSGVRSALIIGNKTSSGSGTVDAVVYGPTSNPPIRGEADVIALAGAGSEAHRMYRRFVLTNKTTPVYMIFPTASGGTAASKDITIATTATAGGVVRWYCEDDFVDVTINSGDSPTNVCDASKILLNNKTEWPVTWNNAAGVMTATAKIAGPRGNEIRVRAVIIGTPATTSDTSVSTALASGATADSWTTALATLLPTRYYYIISPDNSVSGTTYDDLVAQVLTQALPANGIRQTVIAGHVGTQSAASTIAATSSINTARAKIVWQEASELTSGELAASYAAARALYENTVSASYNFDGFGSTPDTQQFWKVPPQSQQSKWPTSGPAGSINTALNNGLTPVAVVGNGAGTMVVMDVTTKHKNGSNFDYRNRDGHITTVCDFFADDMVVIWDQRFRSGKKLAADPPVGAFIQDRSIVHPSIMKAAAFQLVDDYYKAGHLKNIDTIKAGIDVNISDTVATRSGTTIPLQVINLHHQALIEVDDVSSLNA